MVSEEDLKVPEWVEKLNKILKDNSIILDNKYRKNNITNIQIER